MRLLDVNVLLGLAWPNHPFHEIARNWFSRFARKGWATCLLTASAFVRLSANPTVIPGARTPRECLLLLTQLTKFGKHQFLSDRSLSARHLATALARCLGHQQVNDAYLVGLAAGHQARLVTFDTRLSALVERPDQVELLQV
jgi:uncharacterized protein